MLLFLWHFIFDLYNGKNCRCEVFAKRSDLFRAPFRWSVVLLFVGRSLCWDNWVSFALPTKTFRFKCIFAYDLDNRGINYNNNNNQTPRLLPLSSATPLKVDTYTQAAKNRIKRFLNGKSFVNGLQCNWVMVWLKCVIPNHLKWITGSQTHLNIDGFLC